MHGYRHWKRIDRPEKFIAICRLFRIKGGVGKSTTTVSLGVKNLDELDTTISDLMRVVVDNGNLSPLDRGIMKDIEGVDLVPSNIGLSSFEVSLVFP